MQLVSKTILGKEEVLCFHCDLTLDDGETISKTLSFSDYLRLLESNCVPVIKNSYQTIGKLPLGYYNGSLCSNGDFNIIIDYPAAKQPFFYEDLCVEIPFPNLVFFFSCERNQLITKKCFAYKGSLSNDTPLFNYPFSNVQFDSGSICFGNISLSNIKELSQIDDIIKSFIMGKSNGDYYTASRTVNVSYSLLELVQQLKNKDHFPEHYLTAIEHMSMQNLLELL